MLVDRRHIPPVADIVHLDAHPPIRADAILAVAADERLSCAEMDMGQMLSGRFAAAEDGPVHHSRHGYYARRFPCFIQKLIIQHGCFLL